MHGSCTFGASYLIESAHWNKTPLHSAGGGGNRGGAGNFFTGGFFGPGGRMNLLARLRLLVMFWAWCSFLALTVNSVFKLALQATSHIHLPSWHADDAADNKSSTGHRLATASSADFTADVAAAEGPAAQRVTASELPSSASGTAATSSGGEKATAASATMEAEAVEIHGVNPEERTHLDMLRRKHAARAAAQDAQGCLTNGGQLQPGMSAWSLGLYLMLMGAVSFFSIIK